MTQGILLIDFAEGIDIDDIGTIIGKMYKDAKDNISGMSFYATEDKTLLPEIREMCEGE